MINGIALLLVCSGLLASIGFVTLYACSSPWRSSPVGRSTMLLAGSLCALVLFGLVNVLLGEYPLKDEARLAVYLLMNVALWRQLIVLVSVQHRRSGRPGTGRTVVLPTPRESTEAEDKHSVI